MNAANSSVGLLRANALTPVEQASDSMLLASHRTNVNWEMSLRRLATCFNIRAELTFRLPQFLSCSSVVS